MLKRFTDSMRYPISKYITESAERPNRFRFLLNISKISCERYIVAEAEHGDRNMNYPLHF